MSLLQDSSTASGDSCSFLTGQMICLINWALNRYLQYLRSVINPAIFLSLWSWAYYSSAALPTCFYVLVPDVVNSGELCLSLLFWKAKQHTWFVLCLCQLKFQNPCLTCLSANLFMLSQLFVILPVPPICSPLLQELQGY